MLTNKQIFNNAIFDLPKKREGKDFQVFLKDNLVQFKQEISKFRGELRDSLKLEIPFINEQIKFILASLNNYYQGFPAAAYDNIKNALDALDSKNILPIQNLPIINDRNNFYRIRVSDNRSLAKSDLFHIPFESREKVTTQRYSIPGLPCLYLGDSMFVCWEELNRPDFDRIHVSRFDLSQGNFNFLSSAALMQGAVMNYVNDSAPLHFASATNAPVTAIFCSTVPSFGFFPLSDQSFVVETTEKLECKPCGLHGWKECPLGHFKCAITIENQQLLNTLPHNE